MSEPHDPARDKVSAPVADPPQSTQRWRVGAGLVLVAAALVLVGLAGPWLILTPQNDAAVALLGPAGQTHSGSEFLLAIFMYPASLLGGAPCFPGASAFAALVFAVAGASVLARGRSWIPLDLVVAAGVIGLVLVPPTLFFLGWVGFTRTQPIYTVTYAWGLWLCLAGYLTAFLGCFLLRRRHAC